MAGWFDFLKGDGPKDPVEANTPGMLDSLLSDPDVLRSMAEAGTRIGGPGSVGEAIGVPTSNMIQRQAVASAVTKQQQDQKNFRDMLLGLAGNKNFLGPKGDLATADEISFKGDGSGILKFGARDPKQGEGAVRPMTDQPLEAARKPTGTVQPKDEFDMLPFLLAPQD